MGYAVTDEWVKKKKNGYENYKVKKSVWHHKKKVTD